MKLAVIGAMSADHTAQQTHVAVDLWEVVATGIKKKVDSFELSFTGSTLDVAVIKPAVRSALQSAGLIGADDQVLTQSEAR